MSMAFAYSFGLEHFMKLSMPLSLHYCMRAAFIGDAQAQHFAATKLRDGDGNQALPPPLAQRPNMCVPHLMYC